MNVFGSSLEYFLFDPSLRCSVSDILNLLQTSPIINRITEAGRLPTNVKPGASKAAIRVRGQLQTHLGFYPAKALKFQETSIMTFVLRQRSAHSLKCGLFSKMLCAPLELSELRESAPGFVTLCAVMRLPGYWILP
jgi:hypothetical protein